MLEFIVSKKDNPVCSLCEGSILNENYSPNGCPHLFHVACFESWTCSHKSEEYTCPAPNCSVKFTEFVARKTPHGSPSEVVSLKDVQQCPICCETIQAPIAMPESCNHTFCYVCLREWSRVRHECPLDRGVFELILLSDKIGGPIIKRVTPPPVQIQPEESFAEIDTVCEVCSLADDEAHLLLCDHCDRGYHTYCLPVPLSSIPPGDWFCPNCVRRGAIPNSTESGGRPRTVHRRNDSALADQEALESDRSDTGSSNSSDDSDFNLGHQLTRSQQRRFQLRAAQRHRGSRLLQETIMNLAARALSEVSARARQRRSQRQRVRTQLAAERAAGITPSHSRPVDPSQTTLSFEPSVERNCPARLRLNAPTAVTDTVASSDGSNGHMSSQNDAGSQTRRKRLLVLSDSEDEVGFSTNHAPPHRGPRFIKELDANSDVQGTVFSSPEMLTLKRVRVAVSALNDSSLTIEEPGPSNPVDSRWMSDFSLVSPNEKTCRKKAGHRKKLRRRKQRSKLRLPKKSRTLSKRKAKLNVTQRRLRKRIKKNKSNGELTPDAKKSPRSFNRKLTTVQRAPRLSLFGAEPHCSLPVEDSSPFETSNGLNHSSSTIAKSSDVSLLSRIQADQASLFKFTTRHMRINADNSMSPIPVHHTDSSSPNKPSTSSTPLVRLPLKSPIAGPSSVSDVTVNRGPLPVKTNMANGCKPMIKSLSTHTGYAGSNSVANLSSQTDSNGWSPDKLNRVRSFLEANLESRLHSGIIDKTGYGHIIERAMFKIQQKHASKVSDSRLLKLVNDYVAYVQKHSPVKQNGH